MPRPDYQETIDLGATTIQVGVAYSVTPGWPALGPSLTHPGLPAEPAEADITAIYWRPDDSNAPWIEAAGDLHEMLISALGGEDVLAEALLEDAKQAAAYDAESHADWIRESRMEDA